MVLPCRAVLLPHGNRNAPCWADVLTLTLLPHIFSSDTCRWSALGPSPVIYPSHSLSSMLQYRYIIVLFLSSCNPEIISSCVWLFRHHWRHAHTSKLVMVTTLCHDMVALPRFRVSLLDSFNWYIFPCDHNTGWNKLSRRSSRTSHVTLREPEGPGGSYQ